MKLDEQYVYLIPFDLKNSHCTVIATTCDCKFGLLYE